MVRARVFLHSGKSILNSLPIPRFFFRRRKRRRGISLGKALRSILIFDKSATGVSFSPSFVYHSSLACYASGSDRTTVSESHFAVKRYSSPRLCCPGFSRLHPILSLFFLSRSSIVCKKRGDNVMQLYFRTIRNTE